VHWLVALADDVVLPLELFGVKAGRASRGHRSLAPGAVEIAHAAGYTDALERAFVIVDPAKRRARLEEELATRARAEGGRPLDDPELLEESVGLVEYPGALVGAFEERFVERLPQEVLSTCLRHHQKAFSIEGEDGLSARFAVAVNVKDDPEGHVRRGHEWVNTGRLEDALFFWSEDRKRSLADRTPELAGVVFHKDLGTYAEKTRRVARLARLVAERLGAAPDAAARAAELARCDLVTGLVGEFPELQGVVGGLLARADGEPEDVWRSIYDLYRPAGMTDAIPETQLGRVLGIADRLDTLAGGFAVGLVPSGSKDPFGLRRAGTSLVRLAAAEPAIELFELADAAFAGYEGGESGPALADKADEASEPLRAFLLERFGAIAEREGARYDEVSALRVVAERVGLRAADLSERAGALRSFRGSEDFLALVKAAKRVRNILEQAGERGERPDPGEGSEDLALPAETALAKAVANAEDLAEEAAGRRDHEGALRAIAALRPEVDRFFDEILVMDEDARLRRARLGLLAQIHALAHGTVDMAEIVVEGHEKN
jgi:glycyl-tRNA synthetase beta chain